MTGKWRENLSKSKKKYYQKSGTGVVRGENNANFRGMRKNQISYDILGDYIFASGLQWWNLNWQDFINYQNYIISFYQNHWEWQVSKGFEQIMQDRLPYDDLRGN